MGKDNQLTIVWVDFCKDNLLDKIRPQDKNQVTMFEYDLQSTDLGILFYLMDSRNRTHNLYNNSAKNIIIPSFTEIFADPDEVKASDMCFNIFKQLYINIDGSHIVAYIDSKYKEKCAPILDLICNGVDIDKIEKITCSHKNLKEITENVHSEVKAMQAAGTISSIAMSTYVMYQYNYSALGMLGVNFLVRACNGAYTAHKSYDNSEFSACSLFYKQIFDAKSKDGRNPSTKQLAFYWTSFITGNATPSKYELKK